MPARTILSIGTITVALFVLFAISARSPIPAWDDWEWLTWLLSSPVSFSRLFIPHNEHLIPLARVLEWAQYRLQGANGTLIFWVSLFAKLGTGALIWREIVGRWPSDRDWRRTAVGGMQLTFFCAWQLHAIVLASSVLFPLVMLFAALAISAALRATELRGPGRTWWVATSVAASLGAMLTTTNGIAVPAIIAAIAARARAVRSLAAAHLLLFLIGVVTYVTLVLMPRSAALPDSAFHVEQLPLVVGFFCAVFASFITYGSPSAGVIAGAVLISVGLILSARIVREWPQTPRIEKLAVGLIAFTFVSVLMISFGRARGFGLDYAAQSRYATFATAYWAALLLAAMSLWERRSAPRMFPMLAPVARLLAIPAALLLLAVHGLSGIIWFVKADTLRAAGVAVAANVRDDEWIRTVHGSPEAVYTGRELLVAAGDRTVVSALLGQRFGTTLSLPACAGSPTVTSAPGGTTFRLSGKVDVGAREAWILDASGVVVGLAARAPLVDRPDPSGADIFAALRREIGAAIFFSSHRWIGFAPTSASRPLSFVAVDAGTAVCRSLL